MKKIFTLFLILALIFAMGLVWAKEPPDIAEANEKIETKGEYVLPITYILDKGLLYEYRPSHQETSYCMFNNRQG